MCKAAGDLVGNWSQNAETKGVLSSLFSHIGIPICDLIIMNKGGGADVKGTWVHPKVALHLVTWCFPGRSR